MTFRLQTWGDWLLMAIVGVIYVGLVAALILYCGPDQLDPDPEPATDGTA